MGMIKNLQLTLSIQKTGFDQKVIIICTPVLCFMSSLFIYTYCVLLFFLQHQNIETFLKANPTSPLKVKGSGHQHQRILGDHLRPADHRLEQEDKPVQPQERNHLETETDLSVQQRGYYNDYCLIVMSLPPQEPCFYALALNINRVQRKLVLQLVLRPNMQVAFPTLKNDKQNLLQFLCNLNPPPPSPEKISLPCRAIEQNSLAFLQAKFTSPWLSVMTFFAH